MPMITVKLQTAVRRTFRVEQVAGMFDVALVPAKRRRARQGDKETGRQGDAETTPSSPCPLVPVSPRRADHSSTGRTNFGVVQHTLTAEVPGLDEQWTIGAIVGPSGSGKTT